ncbi:MULTISPECIES: zf-HC2 domain-containing protein [Actinoalloteichus]|uniref:Integral membrane protein n=1 Tax=Actinoalloteichus fjordicus TaxID=1612552 RepID=A0AAC9LCS5_9PSEU|nr:MULTISPECIES: zf-HC2 domain-containing protein [Actinoalloteichus]APU15463.1 putative integral membrane protein [Actinoalloteichus fjordicus]APU21531.1 putative integral membrane protein [Actinoalloteichus sp. GBA129-24]
MNCAKYREALSAHLDGEADVLPESEVAGHVHSCSSCQAWERAVTEMRRSMHVRAAPAVPDLTARIMTIAPPAAPRLPVRRILLGLVAIAQIVLGAVQLIGGGDHGHVAHESGLMAGHLINESAAWNLALGIGLLWAAVRTRAAAGQLPMLGGFAVVLALVSIGDLMAGLATPERVLSHGLVFVGVILLIVVYRGHRGAGLPGPAGTGDSDAGGLPVSLPDAVGLVRGVDGPSRAQARAGLAAELDRAA